MVVISSLRSMGTSIDLMYPCPTKFISDSLPIRLFIQTPEIIAHFKSFGRVKMFLFITSVMFLGFIPNLVGKMCWFYPKKHGYGHGTRTQTRHGHADTSFLQKLGHGHVGNTPNKIYIFALQRYLMNLLRKIKHPYIK